MALPRGFRDLEPEVARARLRVIETLSRTYELYGFRPLETPSIEHWETLAGKYGEEAESKLIWRFTDPLSKREYALRFDLTVPLARYVSSHPELSLPFKRYQIGTVWRHEEPQRMRYREFTQADADIVGSPHPEADAEVINVTLRCLLNVGLTDAYVRVNDRRLITYVFRNVLQIEAPPQVLRAIDKLDKIGVEGVREELRRLGLSEHAIERALRAIQVRGKWDEVEGEVRGMLGPQGQGHADEISSLFSLLTDSERAVFDMSLVRGLDYYTGPIFEFGISSAEGPSIGGGGRYDGLIKQISGKLDLPGTGASIGVDRVVDIILRKGSSTVVTKGVKVYVIYLRPELFKKAWEVTSLLRDAGISAEIDLMRRSEAKQRRNASSSGATHLLFVGEREIESSLYTLYDVSTHERHTASLDAIIGLLLKWEGPGA